MIDISPILLSFLKNKNISGLEQNIFLSRPKDIPTTYALIELTANELENTVYTSTFLIEVISSHSRKEAHDTMNLVVSEMSEFDDAVVTESNLLNVIPFDNPTTKEYRYQAIYKIYHY